LNVRIADVYNEEAALDAEEIFEDEALDEDTLSPALQDADGAHLFLEDRHICPLLARQSR